MSDDALAEERLELQEPLAVAHHQTLDGDPRLLGDDLRHGLPIHDVSAPAPHPRRRQIEHADGLVGEVSLVEEALRELDGALEALVLEAHLVVLGVAGREPFEDRDGGLRRRARRAGWARGDGLEADRLLGMWHTAPGLGFDLVNQSPATYLTYRSDATTIEDIAIWDHARLAVGGDGLEPEQVAGLMVTDGFFPLLRIEPILGRSFTAEDDAPGAPTRVMLSHGFWQRAHGGDRGVVGKVMRIGGEPAEVIGVLPESFRFLDTSPEIVFAARFDPAEVIMGNFSYQAIARLAPGATPEKVAAELAPLGRVATERFPGPLTLSMLEQARFAPVIRPLAEDVVGPVRSVLWILLGTVGIVLVIACANVANLFLVRAESRWRELAVRAALGARRRDLAAQFLAESLVLALIGGTLGTGLAALGIGFLRRLGPDHLPRLDEIGLDPPVLAFALVVSILAGLSFGLVPILRTGRRQELAVALREGGRQGDGGRERHRTRNGFVVVQVALAMVLMVGSGLLARSFLRLLDVDPGFRAPEEVLTFRVGIPGAVIEDAEETALAFERILRDLRDLPGVRAAGSTQSVTLDGWDSNDAVYVEDFPTPEGQIPPIRRFKWVQPGYFEAMGNPLIAGRDLEWVDLHEQRPVVVVNEEFSRDVWGSPRAALGKRVATIAIGDGEQVWHEIVGVVGNVHDDGVDQPAPAILYWPMIQADLYGQGTEVRRSMAFVLRAEPGELTGLLPRAREVVWSVVPAAPVAEVRTLEELLEGSLARTSFTLVLLLIASGVALFLGAVGIYGVVSYVVGQRTREIGVRMALGAGRGDVRRMVLRQGLTLTGVGVAVGLLAAIGLTRLMTSLLFGVQPIDPPTYAIVALALALVAALASWVPAARAARVEPATTLRGD